MPILIEKINYAGWPKCYRISDGVVEAVATCDVGPRIIRCGFVGEMNLLKELPSQLGRTGDQRWKIYGGHRLWHSPEDKPRTYYPDNSPIKVVPLSNGIHLIQPVEPGTGIVKEIILTLNPDNHHFQVEHRMTNRGSWPVTFAPWALTVMREGGVGIIPQYQGSEPGSKLPNRLLALWPYSNMNDPRVTWGSRYILVRQDSKLRKPFKLGITVPEGWIGYANNGYLFVKRFAYLPDRLYPDGGVNVELFTMHGLFELESLGPLQEVQPGGTVTHVETWQLGKGLGMINSEADVDSKLY